MVESAFLQDIGPPVIRFENATEPVQEHGKLPGALTLEVRSHGDWENDTIRGREFAYEIML